MIAKNNNTCFVPFKGTIDIKLETKNLHTTKSLLTLWKILNGPCTIVFTCCNLISTNFVLFSVFEHNLGNKGMIVDCCVWEIRNLR